jgi:hypothetical protein
MEKYMNVFHNDILFFSLSGAIKGSSLHPHPEVVIIKLLLEVKCLHPPRWQFSEALDSQTGTYLASRNFS